MSWASGQIRSRSSRRSTRPTSRAWGVSSRAVHDAGARGLPLRRRRRALHPGDHDRPGRCGLDLAARPRLGRPARLTSWCSEPEKHFEAIARPAATASRFTSRPVTSPLARSRGRDRSVSASASRSTRDGRRGRGRRCRGRRSRALHVDPSRLFGAGVHARRPRADRAAAGAAARRTFGSRSTAGQRETCWPLATRARISSSRAARSSGTTIRQRPIGRSSIPSRSRRVADELLELREADGAFERIEEWLRARASSRPAARSSSPTSTSGTGSRSRSARRARPPAGAVPSAPARRVPSGRKSGLASRPHKGASRSARGSGRGAAAEYRGGGRGACATRSRAATSTRSTSCSISRRRSPAIRDALAARLASLAPAASRAVPRATAGRSSPRRRSSSSRRRGDRVRTMPIKGTRPLGAAARAPRSRRRTPPST